MTVIIGIDPDSKAHGVAIYIGGKLNDLHCMNIMQLHEAIENIRSSFPDIEAHIENVKGNKAVWHNRKGSQAAYGMTCQRVGMCKQAQSELERLFEYHGIKVVLHKISKTWKDQAGKKEFEKVTGWQGRSNEDTRSAAYFGFLGLNHKKHVLA